MHVGVSSNNLDDEQLLQCEDHQLVEVKQMVHKHRIRINRNSRREQRGSGNRFRTDNLINMRLPTSTSTSSEDHKEDIKEDAEAESKEDTVSKAPDEVTQDNASYTNTDLETKQTESESKTEMEAQIKSSSDGFYSFGYRYHYWKWYKDREKIDTEYNIGYSYSAWYIAQKYKDLKEELLNNTIKKLEAKSWMKAYGEMKQLHKLSEMARQTLSDNIGKKLHYGIKQGDTIGLEHLMSVKLYTSFDTLSYHFSTTFRKQNQNETDAALKKRNSEYWHWSKLLREAVECFGTSLNKSKIEVFYHGCSHLIFPLFVARFCSPTSTTPQLEVAVGFSEGKGVILELGKYGYRSDAKYFNCAWLSSYGNEDERLLFGGYKPMQILTIRSCTAQHNQDYRYYVHAFTFLNKAMEGKILTSNEGAGINKSHYKILDTMIKHEIDATINAKRMRSVPQYIKDSFHAFCMFKKHIRIELDAMKRDYSKLQQYFMPKGVDHAVSCEYIGSLFKGCEAILIFKHKGAQKISVKRPMFASYLEQVQAINGQTNPIKLRYFEIFNADYDHSLLHGMVEKFRKHQWTLKAVYWKQNKTTITPVRNLKFVRNSN